MEAKTYSITNGPNAFDLAFCLFRRDIGLLATFTLKGESEKISTEITGVEFLPKSGVNDWILKGFFNQPPYYRAKPMRYTFTATYSTETRQGTIRVTLAQ